MGCPPRTGAWCNAGVILRTNRLELDAPDAESWARLLEGDVDGPAAEGYPTEGDLIMARLVVDGHLPAGEWGPWRLRESSTGHLVGGVGFKGAPSQDGIVEIGYGLAPAARGRGYATEAVLALVDHARSRGVAMIVADTEVANEASMAVLRRCGFRPSVSEGRSEPDPGTVWWERSSAD